MNDPSALGCSLLSWLDLSQEARRDGPVLPSFGDDRDRPSVVQIDPFRLCQFASLLDSEERLDGADNLAGAGDGRNMTRTFNDDQFAGWE